MERHLSTGSALLSSLLALHRTPQQNQAVFSSITDKKAGASCSPQAQESLSSASDFLPQESKKPV